MKFRRIKNSTKTQGIEGWSSQEDFIGEDDTRANPQRSLPGWVGGDGCHR